MNATSLLQIEAKHINELLVRLDRHAKRYFTETAGSGSEWRVLFVDADILSVYANGQTKNPVNAWSSLLSLLPSARGSTASAEATALANVSGQAIVRYAFGAMLRSLEVQRGRVYITPEHEREFKGIVHAILHSDVSEPGWLDALKLAYLELADLESAPSTAVDAANRIVKALESNVAAGASDRAYTLLQKAVSKLATNLIVLPEQPSRSAFFSVADANYRSLIGLNREPVWEAFEHSLRKRVDDVEELFALKRFVFDLHDAETGADRPFAYFVNRVKTWVSSTDAPTALASRRDLDGKIRIAVREAADLSALARINAFGQWLQKTHPPPDSRRWEIVLISGSGMLQRTLDDWPASQPPPMVSVVHPLNLLRHVDLWDPAGTRRLGSAEYLDQPHEFALSRIFGGTHRAGDPATNNAEVAPFVQSLQEQLEVVVAREAMEGDRSLRQLKATLESTHGFDRVHFVEAVRNLVTQRFAQTFNRLTELFPGDKTMLPASSLPSIYLPQSSEAMKFMAKVRATLDDPKLVPVAFVNLDDSLKEDRTAYSGLLALATGYMARGHRWIPAAQTMAATATLLARGRRLNQYPEGNEALYLEAFLLRMSLTVKSDLPEFARHHRSIMDEAKSALGKWEAQNPDAARLRMGKSTKAPTHAQWIAFRYDLEVNARDVFCCLIKHLGPDDSVQCAAKSLEALTEHSLELHLQGADLAATSSSWAAPFEPSIWYCGIQAGLSTLQSWLLWSEALRAQGSNRDPLEAFESRIADKVRDLWIHKEKLGKVLPMLARIYAQKTGLAGVWATGKPPRPIDFRVRFAGIDEKRMKWLSEVLVGGGASRR